MDSQQITTIAIKIGELQQKSSITFWIAIIGGLFGLVSAIITGFFTWRQHAMEKQHQKQWAYIQKRSLLIDNAIEICARMMFNKLLVVYNNDSAAAANLFVLQKEELVIESQFVVYGSLELAQTLMNFKDLIIQTPNSEFISKWKDIHHKGHEYLLLCRRTLGNNLSQKFEKFSSELKVIPPTKAEVEKGKSDKIGSLSS